MVEISCGSTTGSVYSFYGSESRPVIYDRRSLKVLTPDAIALKNILGVWELGVKVTSGIAIVINISIMFLDKNQVINFTDTHMVSLVQDNISLIMAS